MRKNLCLLDECEEEAKQGKDKILAPWKAIHEGSRGHYPEAY